VPREIALLTNPSSGGGRGTRTAAIARPRLEEAGFAVRGLVGRDADEALDLARSSVASGVESLVVVGGDGLVHLAVQALVGSAVALGIIPAGTGNDLARTLDIPRGDPRLAADVVVGSRTRRIDVARCGATYFVTVLAAGFASAVNERANRMSRPRGRLRYAVATLAELRVLEPLAYTLELDGEVRRVEATLVAVGNGPSFGGGLRIAHGALVDDGWLDVVVVGSMTRTELLRTYPRLRTGAHLGHRAVERHRVRSVAVDAAGAVAYADGEPLHALPVRVETEPSALEVLVPR
jgi:diacylglycerol kinase (ATP)